MDKLSQQQMVQFLDKLQFEKHYSPHTVAAYRRDLNAFTKYCERSDISRWQELDESNVRAYIAGLHRSGLSGKSLQRHLSTLRGLFTFLIRENVLSANVALGVRAPKSLRKLPDALDVDQVTRLLSFPTGDVLAMRDKAILELFYSSGLRLSELVALDIRHVDIPSAMIEVTGKGQKTRTLPIGTHALGALRKWLSQREAFVVNDCFKFTGSDTGALFLSQRGNRLGQRSIQERMKYWARRQGIDINVYPHILRHSFASHLLESSGDLRAVQELLGHADISTTQIYTHLDFQHLARVYDDSHPRARKKS